MGLDLRRERSEAAGTPKDGRLSQKHYGVFLYQHHFAVGFFLNIGKTMEQGTPLSFQLTQTPLSKKRKSTDRNVDQ